MRPLSEIQNEVAGLSRDDRLKLLTWLQESVSEHPPARPALAIQARDLWMDTAEFRVSTAQALSQDEIRRRSKSVSWVRRLFD